LITIPPPLLDTRITLNDSKALNRSEVKSVELRVEVDNGLVPASAEGELVGPQTFSSGISAEMKDDRNGSRGFEEAFVAISKCEVDVSGLQGVSIDLVLEFGREGGEASRCSKRLGIYGSRWLMLELSHPDK